MDSREQIETGRVSEQEKMADSSSQADAAKLVEMGNVSVETKGTIHGLELGFTPRSF
ncbi:MAG: hypothetical protein JSR66_30135 [Proteobacteria bacterium]|nr:hypothetical protein [Pseudomonadota bacterium]